MAEKPVEEIVVTDIDYVGVDQGVSGNVKILFETAIAREIALVLPPAVVAKLELRLEQVRAELASRMRSQ